MNSHLSSEQLECALHGPPSREVSLHLAACAECAEEVVELREALGNFRVAAAASAERHYRLAAAPAAPAARRLPRVAWAAAMSALVLSIAAPIALHRRTVTPRVTGNVAEHSAVSDDALLNDIQNDLSSSVPSPLLPLASTSTNSVAPNLNSRKN
jgi:anti-sigma factor RsiW